MFLSSTLLLIASVATAQPHGGHGGQEGDHPPSPMQVCHDDTQDVCTGGTGIEFISCLKTNENILSDDCLDFISTNELFICGNEIAEFCKTETDDVFEAFACLDDNSDQLGDECVDALSATMSTGWSDYSSYYDYGTYGGSSMLFSLALACCCLAACSHSARKRRRQRRALRQQQIREQQQAPNQVLAAPTARVVMASSVPPSNARPLMYAASTVPPQQYPPQYAQQYPQQYAPQYPQQYAPMYAQQPSLNIRQPQQFTAPPQYAQHQQHIAMHVAPMAPVPVPVPSPSAMYPSLNQGYPQPLKQ